MPKISGVEVDDSAQVRSKQTEIINRQADMECIGAASDPFVAREMIRNLNPDVITLDVEMPRMDGLDFLSKLMRLRPMPVVMVSTLTERGAEVTLKALELGAVDFVSKPKIGVADGLRQLSDDITDKIRVASKARIHRLAPAASVTPASASATGATSPRAASASAPAPAKALNTGSYSLGRLSTEKLIFIGASTGGTEATKEVLVALPAATLLFAFMGTGSSFLAFAIMAGKRGIENPVYHHKSLYYLGGLTEATETLAAFVAMCWWPQHFAAIAYGFAALCGLTIAVRIHAGYVSFKPQKDTP